MVSVEAGKLLHPVRLERVDQPQVPVGGDVRKLPQIFVRKFELEGVVELDEVRTLPE